MDRDKFDQKDFALKLTCIDDIVRDIANASDPVLFKVDVARAFRNLRVDPANCIKFGIKWQGSYYIDGVVPFGWVLGTVAFQLCSDSIAFMMKKLGVNLHCYIDNYVAVATRYEAKQYFEKLCDLLQELGLPIIQDKLTPPTKSLTVLGIQIDIQANTMRIDPNKLAQIYSECLTVKNKKFLSKKAYQSLLGKLLYIHDFHQDLDWFIRFLPHFNGVTL